jgi:DNA mismatch repair protein MutL
VLDVSVDPATVDVNVHPRKLEVRWSKEEEVREQVQTAVENALQKEGLLRSSAPRGRSAPEQTKIEPSSASKDADESETESPDTTGRSRTTKSEADRTGNATQDVGNSKSDETDSSRCSPSRSQSTASWETTSTPSRSSSSSSAESSSGSTPQSSVSDTKPSPHERRSRSPTTTEPNTQKTLSGEDAHETTKFDTFPDLRVLGQLHDTYIVAEADDGLIFIDQHAADERINYERLQAEFEGETTTQALAEPVEIALTAKEAELFSTYEDALARLGFVANQVGDRTVEVKTVPSLVADSAGPEVIRDVLAEMVTGKEAAEQTVEAVADELLADMACYPSITGNTSLTDGSVVDLLSTLDECENPWACPHGRPVLIHIDSDEIDDRFERDYPGH